MKRHYVLMQEPVVRKDCDTKAIILLETSDALAAKALEEFIDRGYIVVGNLESSLNSRALMAGLNAKKERLLQEKRRMLNAIANIINKK